MHAAPAFLGHRRPAGQRGVSLVEAIVAMAVMAFGMMAIVALQASLRQNSDVAKQRTEAVRIAQEAVEAWRGFAFMPAASGVASYAGIASLAASGVAGYTTNTDYLLERSVTLDVPAPGMKSLQVVVSWVDRSGQTQAVTLNTIVAAADPALSGILSLLPSGSPVRLPLGRNPGVPRLAMDLGNGTSAFKPPGAAGATVALIFNNVSGVVTTVCTATTTSSNSAITQSDLSNCVDQEYFLLTGFVRFSTGTGVPNAVNPTGSQIDLGMVATATAADSSNGVCFVEPVQSPPIAFTEYSCLVPRGTGGTWTGRTRLVAPLDLTSVDVCRYSTGVGGNADHPQLYLLLDRSLASQNFLLVDQGVVCPSTTPASTEAHQPPV